MGAGRFRWAIAGTRAARPPRREAASFNTLDVCLLGALCLRADQDGLASFEEKMVFDVFDQVCDLVEPGVENSRKRATHTIQRLRSQRMLAWIAITQMPVSAQVAGVGGHHLDLSFLAIIAAQPSVCGVS
ncbi:MAG: hypothetical protein GY946_25135 [bacterium]|nr:hypothetical protein [bacterium]